MKNDDLVIMGLLLFLLWTATRKKEETDVHFVITEPDFEGTEVIQ